MQQESPSSDSPASALSISNPSRCYAVDWLRVLALFSVFLLHNLRFFDFIPWHVKNAEQSELVMQIVLFRITWGMPLLFLVAGAASAWAARRRTASQLLTARLWRLGVPFLFGMVVLIPPQRWIEARHHAGFDGTFAEFLRADLQRLSDTALSLSPTWFGFLGHHLWFLGFLLLYGVLATPFLARLARRGPWLVSALARLASRRGGLLWLALPLFLSQITLVPYFPRYLDWADFCRYLLFFAFGYLFTLDRRFFDAAKRDIAPVFALGLAGLGFQLWTALALDSMRDFMAAPGSAPGWLVFQLWIAVSSFVWPMLFLGLALRYLDRASRALDYLNEAALPFYALHQTVILAIGLFVVRLEASIVSKLSIITVASFVTIATIYETVIRHSPILRRLFGMKPLTRQKQSHALPLVKVAESR